MEIKLDKYLDFVKDESTKQILTKLQDYGMKTAVSESPFLLSQMELLSKYLQQVSEKKISQMEYEMLMEDLKDLVYLESQKMNLITRQLAIELLDLLTNVAVKGLSKIILF